MRKDILIYPSTQKQPFAASIGMNFGPPAFLIINKEVSLKDPEASRFFCKHELSHINTNDTLIKPSIAFIASAVAAFAVPYIKSWLFWWAPALSYCIPFLIGSNTYYRFSIFSEDRADSFACKYSTPEELMGMERFLQGNLEINKEIRKKHPGLISEDGNYREEVSHSSDTKRLDVIRKELRKRNVLVQESNKQSEKMQKMKENSSRGL